KYYHKWIKDSVEKGAKVTLQDAVSISEILYTAAKTLNGLPEGNASFSDLKGSRPAQPIYFSNSLFLLSLLADGKLGALPEGERPSVLARRAQCQGFLAADAEGWEKTKDFYLSLITNCKLISPKNQLDPDVLKVHPVLLPAYIELGAVYLELARAGQSPQFD